MLECGEGEGRCGRRCRECGEMWKSVREGEGRCGIGIGKCVEMWECMG